jgi:hypothetical protein
VIGLSDLGELPQASGAAPWAAHIEAYPCSILHSDCGRSERSDSSSLVFSNGLIRRLGKQKTSS